MSTVEFAEATRVATNPLAGLERRCLGAVEAEGRARLASPDSGARGLTARVDRFKYLNG